MARRRNAQPPKLRHDQTGYTFVEWQGRRRYLGAKIGTPEADAAYEDFKQVWRKAQLEAVAERMRQQGGAPAPPDLTVAELRGRRLQRQRDPRRL